MKYKNQLNRKLTHLEIDQNFTESSNLSGDEIPDPELGNDGLIYTKLNNNKLESLYLKVYKNWRKIDILKLEKQEHSKFITGFNNSSFMIDFYYEHIRSRINNEGAIYNNKYHYNEEHYITGNKNIIVSKIIELQSDTDIYTSVKLKDILKLKDRYNISFMVYVNGLYTLDFNMNDDSIEIPNSESSDNIIVKYNKHLGA